MILHPLHIVHLEALPTSMNNPLCYEPHPLCIMACKELQAYLGERKDWREEIDRGKMFGVLIVEKPNGDKESSDKTQSREIGYLAAYSGQIGGRSDWEDFVPAVFDYLQPDGYFKVHEAEITNLNHAIARLSSDEKMKEAKHIIQSLQQERQSAIAAYQEKMKEAKAKRDARRQEALLAAKASKGADTSKETDSNGSGLSPEEEQAMIKESQFIKAELRRLKKALSEKTTLETEYADFQENLLKMKQLRKTLSDNLQQWLFMQFRMLNEQGESKNLLEIFRDEALQGNNHGNVVSNRVTAMKMVPPAGSGECCEPKLLQYAYQHGLKPLQMAMFWWGESPKEEIRHHLQYYPACNGKCKPILHWMLPASVFALSSADATYGEKNYDGTTNLASIYNKVEILYDDHELAVVHKPEGLLSVPGKDAHQPSIYAWARKHFPAAEGPLIVHRLDMATSGLMIIAKTEFAYHRLQKEFLHHRVQKKYVAIVCRKEVSEKEGEEKILQEKSLLKKDAAEKMFPKKGTISLPLMPDYLDRPRQIVSHEQGKEAITEYEIVSEEPQKIRLSLYPKTGRTHQLRVHCAHHEGLNTPILGDPLYGNEKAPRLYLHAEEITFEHPLTGKRMTVKRKADF